MSYDNLPPGTSDRDADAPWNVPDFDGADENHGIYAVTGDDSVLTAECFSDFVRLADSDSERQQPLIKSSVFTRMVSNATLLSFMLKEDVVSELQLAALAEFRARYLADQFTKRCIESAADHWIAKAQS
jgi:hypothetical protein